nr:uncharacterized protein LOC112742355 [Arachis hypogaea]
MCQETPGDYEEWKCIKYEGGLRSNIFTSVGPIEIRTFSELVNKSRVVEECVKKVATKRGSHKGSFPQKQGKSFAPRGPTFKREGSFKRPNNNNSQGKRYGKYPHNEQACARCGSHHLEAPCKTGWGLCYSCGKAGHKAVNCPEKQKQVLFILQSLAKIITSNNTIPPPPPNTLSLSLSLSLLNFPYRHLHTPNQSKNIHLSLTHRRRDQESHEIKMATKQSTTTTLVHVNEDYIDMELVTSCSSNLCPPQKSYSREFEFQMTPLSSNEKDSTASVADELFYNGKLLPLHNVKSFSSLEDSNFPIITNTNTNNNHLFDDSFSNIISPSESCRLSSDFAVTPDEYLFEWSNCSSQINNNSNVLLPNNKKSSSSSWSKKLKQINVGQRIKNSRSYIRSLFFTKATSGSSRCKECQDLKMKNKKNNHQFGMNILEDDEFSSIHGRRSFSGVVQRHCGPSKSSSLSTSSSGSSSCSSSFSFSSSSGYNNNDLQFFKRNIINAANNCEIEGSIEGAIAHCKKSHQKFASPKVAICGKQENEELLPTIPRREVN